MLRLNAAVLSEADLRDAVAAHCSRFGCVLGVNVVAPPGHDYTAASVQMSSPAETSTLLESLSDAKVGEVVIIWIEQFCAAS